MTELLPCPFCGWEAHTYHNWWWHVKCERALHGCVTMSAFNTEAEAIAAWNTRAERTCEKLPQLSDTTCIVRRGGMEMEFGYWRCSECECENFEGAKYCMGCGAKAVEQ